MRINRSHPDDNFTISPNAMLQDERLSYVALGILVRLLSRPDGWSTNADTLWRQAKRSHGTKSGQGREAIRAAFVELEKYGYLVRRKVKGEGGLIATVMELYDTPDHQGTDFRAPEIQASDIWAPDSLSSIERTDQQSTDVESTEDKHSSALAGARAAAADASADIRVRELRDFYDAVNRMSEHDVRMALLKLEKRHPRIYGQCRRQTLDHLKAGYPALLKSDKGPQNADRLAYQYALRHYSKANRWPMWLIRELPKPVHLKSVS